MSDPQLIGSPLPEDLLFLSPASPCAAVVKNIEKDNPAADAVWFLPPLIDMIAVNCQSKQIE